MKIFYVTNYNNEKQFWEVIQECQEKPAGAASQNFEGLILKGLDQQEEVDVTACSFRLIPSYPAHKKIFWSGYREKLFEFASCVYLPFINLPIIKQVCFSIAIIPEVIKWLIENRKQKKAIIFTCINIPMVFPVLLLRLFFSCPIITIVPDLPTLVLDYAKLKGLKNLLKAPCNWLSKQAQHRFDAYVLITENMNEVVNRKNRPYIVVEGIVDFGNDLEQHNFTNSSVKGIMYAGALYKQYGIESLIKGFIKIDDPHAELWLFGAGDMENEIIQYAKSDSRIKLFGMRPREEVIKYEMNATLLVNPRPSNHMFTKYSFPSKTMEYMASGTPLLTTQLKGIPAEYFTYCFVLDNESEDGIASKLESILSMSRSELYEFGMRARNFVLENKNCAVQVKRIINLIDKTMC